ncbi:MAG: hypothetical protein ACQETL_16770 [Bacteroidota bacterium]
MKIFQILFILGFSVLSVSLSAQQCQYIFFLNYSDRPFNESSVFLLEPLSNGSVVDEQSLEIGESIFRVKYLKFPSSDTELMVCCEMDSLSFYGVEQYTVLDSVLGSRKADSLLNTYESKDIGFNFFRSNKRKSFYYQSSDLDFYFYKADIRYCDCKYLYANKAYQLPLGYEAYIEEVKKLFRVKSKERKILLTNIDNIKKQKLIQHVIKELNEDWAKD